MSDLPLIIKGKIGPIKITFHGENHSNLDNSYYKGLKLPVSAVLLVEHSNNACEIRPEDEEAFRRHAKGSNWVFYTQKKAKNPNVVCFDPRAEQGFLNAHEEAYLKEVVRNFHEASPVQIRQVFDSVMMYLHLFQTHREHFDVLPGYYDRSMDLLSGQFKALATLIRYRKAHPESLTVLDMKLPINVLINGIAAVMIDNIIKIASVSTDVALMTALHIFSSSKASEIHVFCGKNHALRMTNMVPITGVKITGYMEPALPELAKIEMEGDPELDQQIAGITI
jgi:hypothetical protein